LSGTNSAETAASPTPWRCALEVAQAAEAEARIRKPSDQAPAPCNAHADVASSSIIWVPSTETTEVTAAEALTREGWKSGMALFGNEHLGGGGFTPQSKHHSRDEGKRAESDDRREMLRCAGGCWARAPVGGSALADVAWAAGFTGKLDEAESLEARRWRFSASSWGLSIRRAESISSWESAFDKGNLSGAEAVLSAALSIQSKLSVKTTG